MTRLSPTALALTFALAAAFVSGCGGAPDPKPEAEADAPREAPDEAALTDDGAKPGEHGCGSCAVRVCAAGADISGLRVQIRLDTKLEDVRYEKAVLRLKAPDGRSEATPLDPAKLAAGVGSTQTVSSAKFSELKRSSDVKGATGELALRWSSPRGPGGEVFTLPVAIGACP